jgi:two-component system, chemotaxis family, protein-glutamate methylesterase/glutaminase
LSNQVNVVVVDDSAIVRGLLTRALETDPQLKVVGAFMHGQFLMDWLKANKADVVLLDVEMPVMDGLETLERIQAEYPKIKVVMASSLTQKGGEVAVKAMAMGAADCIGKPVASSHTESIKILVEQLVPIVVSLGTVSVDTPVRVTPKPVATKSEIAVDKKIRQFICRPEIVVIGASTGGPKALTTVLTGLPSDFETPIFIVQHMPASFTPMLAKHIMQDTGRPCSEAIDDGLVENNHTYVAPGEYHMELVRKKGQIFTKLNQNEPEHFCRPSVNPLFESATNICGEKLLSVMLTGMGDDGIEGTREVVRNNGFVIAQNQETCVVWGMPRAVVDEGLADMVLPLDKIASEVRRLCSMEICRA